MTTVQSYVMESAAFAILSRFDPAVSELLLHLFTSFAVRQTGLFWPGAKCIIAAVLSTSYLQVEKRNKEKEERKKPAHAENAGRFSVSLICKSPRLNTIATNLIRSSHANIHSQERRLNNHKAPRLPHIRNQAWHHFNGSSTPSARYHGFDPSSICTLQTSC